MESPSLEVFKQRVAATLTDMILEVFSNLKGSVICNSMIADEVALIDPVTVVGLVAVTALLWWL